MYNNVIFGKDFAKLGLESFDNALDSICDALGVKTGSVAEKPVYTAQYDSWTDASGNIVYQLCMPGCPKDMVDVTVDEKSNVINVSGKRMVNGKEHPYQYTLATIYPVAGAFCESYLDGVLTLVVKKPEEQQPKIIKLTVK
ncbi:MAG: Hsp20/alpha crystallin family protein [Fibrobacter sp.]|nr:Hsp20/alpha crystallin family protein [Fibrobacter sp.]